MLHGIVGLMNSGKTLYQTYLLGHQFKSGKEIISNYNLAFTHKLINRDFLLYLGESTYRLDNICFGLDELWIWLDARGSQQNKVATYFFNQSSKDDTEIYFTSQHASQIDKRIRNNLHKLTQCSRVLRINNKFVNISDENRFLPKQYQDKLYIKCVEFKRVNLGLISEMVYHKTIYIRAKPIFKLYNTSERIVRKNG